MNIEKRSSVVENRPKIAIGDEVIDKDGRIYIITQIDKKKGVSIGYRNGSGYGTIEWQDWDRRNYIKLDHPIEELEKIAFAEVQDLSRYEEETPDQTPSDSTDIATRMPKEALQDLKAVAEAKAGHIELLKRIMERKQNQLANILHNYRTQVAKIQKVLDVIELYLGVHEEIIILREGEKCSMTEPIHIRQQVLFMDEEFADTEDQGLDFKRLEDFDNWLTTDPKNLDRLLPEKKGIVVLRVRRRDKEYFRGDESLAAAFARFEMNKENQKTYILIRNGECLYRIWTGLVIYPRFFPLRSEMSYLYNLSEGRVPEGYEDNHKFGLASWDIEEAKNQLHDYKRNLLIIQGLIDRTSIFQPLPHAIKLFDPETYGNAIRLIYDDETALPTGRLPWKEWHDLLNSKIERGTRVYVSDMHRRDTRNGYFDNRTSYQYRMAYGPSAGIYSVETVESDKPEYHEEGTKEFSILYKPDDSVWNRYDSHERVRRISWRLFSNDKEVLNYDLITLDDIQYYITNRVDRSHYLEMLPVLRAMKILRLKELEWEKGFVENLCLRYKIKDDSVVWNTIEWWKNKVIWKRPIMKDDAKALRMITWKVKKELGLADEDSFEA